MLRVGQLKFYKHLGRSIKPVAVHYSEKNHDKYDFSIQILGLFALWRQDHTEEILGNLYRHCHFRYNKQTFPAINRIFTLAGARYS